MSSGGLDDIIDLSLLKDKPVRDTLLPNVVDKSRLVSWRLGAHTIGILTDKLGC
jgi:hypothetical protein